MWYYLRAYLHCNNVLVSFCNNICCLDVNIEEESYIDETPEAVAEYIVDQLIASVIAPVGKWYYFLSKNT